MVNALLGYSCVVGLVKTVWQYCETGKTRCFRFSTCALHPGRPNVLLKHCLQALCTKLWDEPPAELFSGYSDDQ